MKLITCILVIFACCDVFPRSEIDNLTVARYLTERLMHAPESVDNLDAGSVHETMVRYPTYESLFLEAIPSNRVGYGWSACEKQAAFEQFVRLIPQLYRQGGFDNLKVLGDAAIGFCFEHDVTNSTELAASILADPANPCAGPAAHLFEKRLIPSSNVVSFVETLIGSSAADSALKDRIACGLVVKLMEFRESLAPDVVSNGVAVLLGNPPGCHTSRALDGLILEMNPAYAFSSNRLDFAVRTLMLADGDESVAARRVRQYFAPVTNQLLNAVQPLPEVEALRGL